MNKTRKTKFCDRLYFCAKKKTFIHVKWDHSVEGVDRWWYSNYLNYSGYIKGKIKTPKSWIEMGWWPEGTIDYILGGAK